jgi:hypothetical protein
VWAPPRWGVHAVEAAIRRNERATKYRKVV